MKSILFVNQKGGVGKSTLSINTAVELSKNFKVELMDSDPQGSVLTFLQTRENNGIDINLEFKYPNLKGVPRELDNTKADVVIIDSQGQANSDVLKVLETVDYIIIPIQPSLLDIEATRELLEKMQQINRLNNYKVLINGAQTNSPGSIKEVKEFLINSNLSFFSNVISFRKIYKDSMFFGKSIMEMENDTPRANNAQQEFKQFIHELVTWIN